MNATTSHPGPCNIGALIVRIELWVHHGIKE